MRFSRTMRVEATRKKPDTEAAFKTIHKGSEKKKTLVSPLFYFSGSLPKYIPENTKKTHLYFGLRLAFLIVNAHDDAHRR